MDHWAEVNYNDTFPFDVARNLNKDMSLDAYTKTLSTNFSRSSNAEDRP